MWLSLWILIPLVLFAGYSWNAKSRNEKALRDLWSAMVLLDVASHSYLMPRWMSILAIYEASDIKEKDKVRFREALELMSTFRDEPGTFAANYGGIKTPRYNLRFGEDWKALEKLGYLANASTNTIVERREILEEKGYNSKLLERKKR